jgi:hypothetical protein
VHIDECNPQERESASEIEGEEASGGGQ